MAGPRRFELDELSVRPGTYFNPQTEVLIVVDDSPEVEQAIFDEAPAAEEADWVLVSDETPVDETTRDELLERFQARYRGGATASVLDDEDDEEDDEPEELDPDELHPDEDELD